MSSKRKTEAPDKSTVLLVLFHNQLQLIRFACQAADFQRPKQGLQGLVACLSVWQMNEIFPVPVPFPFQFHAKLLAWWMEPYFQVSELLVITAEITRAEKRQESFWSSTF